MSLVHNGVLFLDEVAEFGRRSLEVLRQPLEEGAARVARASGVAIFPARFILAAAMNPCPCGYAGDPSRECRCTPQQVIRYHGRLSGPLRDRLDLIVPVSPVQVEDLLSDTRAESSAEIRRRVVRARGHQTKRYAGLTAKTNADLERGELGVHCRIDQDGKRLLSRAISRFRLSARGYDRVRRVARTLADLDDSTWIRPTHVAEALSYRGIRPES